jgi:glycosyltransferase involved in cell wall biosynthesis
MTVSVIVRTKDRPVFLARALDDILRQSHPASEILVVNDGGDAPTAAYVHSGSADAPSIRVVSHPSTQGRGAALLTGVEQSEGDLLAVHDDDDVWSPHFLEKTLFRYRAAKAALPDCIGAVARMRRRIERQRGSEIETIREEDVPSAGTSKGVVNAARYLTFQEDIYPIQAVFEREAALRHAASIADMRLFEDRLLFSRMLLEGELAVVEEVLAYQSIRTESAALRMNGTSRQEIDFYFAVLQNRLLRGSGPGSATALQLAPFTHEIRRAVAAPRAGPASEALRGLFARFKR